MSSHNSATALTCDPNNIHPITGLVLAGGRATRMGGEDKGLIRIAGEEMAARVARALTPQVDQVLVNANRNQARYQALLGVPVIADSIGDFAGPLAGMLSALEYIDQGWLLTCPCDSPLIANDLAARLAQAAREAQVGLAIAHDGERLQPVFALMHCSLRDSMRSHLERGERKIDRWYAQHPNATADFSDCTEMFLNINTPADREALEKRMQ